MAGSISGNGTMDFKSHPSFLKYVGEWKDGQFEGHGHLTLKKDEHYKGGWQKGERYGLGHHQFSKSDPFVKYQGNWLKDEFEGIGLLTQ